VEAMDLLPTTKPCERGASTPGSPHRRVHTRRSLSFPMRSMTSDPENPKPFVSADPASPHWSEPKYPTDEEIAELPDYVHPATRWSLAVISLVAGCVASGTAVMRIVGGDITERPLPGADPVEVTSAAAAWVGLISGLCWMMAGVTISRGRITATGVWFLLGIVTGIVVTIL